MSKQITCDRCKKVILKETPIGILSFHSTDHIANIIYELCPHCSQILFKLIKNKIDNEQQ